MRLLASTALLIALAAKAGQPAAPISAAGTFVLGGATIVIAEQEPGRFTVRGLSGSSPIALELRGQALTGRVALFDPVRIELASDGQTATVRTRAGDRAFTRFEPEPPAGEPQWPPEDLRKKFHQGRDLIRMGRWREAKAVFEQLLQLSPTFGDGTVQQYLARCEQEVPDLERLERAEALLDQGDRAGAAQALAEVTPDTLQLSRRDRVRERLAKQQSAEAPAALESERRLRLLRQLTWQPQE